MIHVSYLLEVKHRARGSQTQDSMIQLGKIVKGMRWSENQYKGYRRSFILLFGSMARPYGDQYGITLYR